MADALARPDDGDAPGLLDFVDDKRVLPLLNMSAACQATGAMRQCDFDAQFSISLPRNAEKFQRDGGHDTAPSLEGQFFKVVPGRAALFDASDHHFITITIRP